jgi:hypothetical protein
MFIIINLDRLTLSPTTALKFLQLITMEPFYIPWACVDLNPKQPELEKTTLNIQYQKITNLNTKTTLIYFTYFSE